MKSNGCEIWLNCDGLVDFSYWCGGDRNRNSNMPIMDDSELARYLHLTPDEAAKVIPKLTPEQRTTYMRLGKFGDDWNLYAAGFGPRPTGALVDTERSTKKRRAWR